jgi:enoyl-CoA hydratase/carnithine racemase
MGEYLALTGHRLDGAEAYALGLATHYLSAASLDEAKAAIVSAPQEIAATLDRLSVLAPQAKIMAHAAEIDREPAVHEHPHVVVAGEREDLAPRGVRAASARVRRVRRKRVGTPKRFTAPLKRAKPAGHLDDHVQPKQLVARDVER